MMATAEPAAQAVSSCQQPFHLMYLALQPEVQFWAAGAASGLEELCQYCKKNASGPAADDAGTDSKAVGGSAQLHRMFDMPSTTNIGDPGCDGTGGSVWPGAVWLSHYLLEDAERREGLADKVICELGAGSGACGLALALHCGGVCLTDGSAQMVALLEANADRNSASNATLWALPRPLLWGTAADVLAARRSRQTERPAALSVGGGGGGGAASDRGRGYEVIVGSELMYRDSSLRPLLESVDALLHDLPGSVAYLCFRQRGPMHGDCHFEGNQLRAEDYVQEALGDIMRQKSGGGDVEGAVAGGLELSWLSRVEGVVAPRNKKTPQQSACASTLTPGINSGARQRPGGAFSGYSLCQCVRT